MLIKFNDAIRHLYATESMHIPNLQKDFHQRSMLAEAHLLLDVNLRNRSQNYKLSLSNPISQTCYFSSTHKWQVTGNMVWNHDKLLEHQPANWQVKLQSTITRQEQPSDLFDHRLNGWDMAQTLLNEKLTVFPFNYKKWLPMLTSDENILYFSSVPNWLFDVLIPHIHDKYEDLKSPYCLKKTTSASPRLD